MTRIQRLAGMVLFLLQPDVMALAGVASIVAGVAMLSVPTAFVVAGLLLWGTAMAVDSRNRKRGK